jgi:hypothetical protein
MPTKEEIIKELQKYTKENGGKTPGEKAFFDNTAIGIWDRMKYWPNYGELVREAGLTPNKFDKTKYSKEQLCDLFIATVREIGKWPTRGILDVKHTNNPSFPHSGTFYKKLGLTKDLAVTLLDYVQQQEGYEDIIDFCNLTIKNNEEAPSIGEISKGYVYIGKQHGKYKIGKAKDFTRRREDITLLGSEPFDLLHVIETDDMTGVEKYWHERFKSKWIRGEWFKLTLADLKAFKRWKKIV